MSATSDYAIQVRNLGKEYQIGGQERYRSLRDALVETARLPWTMAKSLLGPSRQLSDEEKRGKPSKFWAVRDVSFDVKRGEVVGIIGRNGAGKSTLLKLLSRITEPSRGEITLYGRMGSLLEVGTGFHPELTGRENIYLNGAVLGMRRSEIRRKFDEIVAFAEVEKFLDTPVKHYSSGMHTRLAFAVAAHLEPEILVVDEVLAVGDASFQRKCMNKMEEVGTQGRTVLFVSHNMPAVTRLCPRSVLLDQGQIVGDGPSPKIVGLYLNSGMNSMAARTWEDPATAPGNATVRLRAAHVRNRAGTVVETIDIQADVCIELQYDVLVGGTVLVPNLHFFNEEGVCVFVAIDSDSRWHRRPRPAGTYVSTAWVPGNTLAEGILFVGVAISTMDPVIIHFYEREAVAFQVIETFDGTTARGDYAGTLPGVMRPLLEWQTTGNGAALEGTGP